MSLTSAFAKSLGTQNPEPIPGLTSPNQSALDRLRNGPKQIRQIIHDYRQTVADRGREISHDENLSAEGRDNAMRQMRQAAGEAAADQVGQVRTSLDQDLAILRNNLEARWPQPKAGLEALLERQAGWSRMRMLLESGLDARKLVEETDDPEELHTLRAELPAWLRANRRPQFFAYDIDAKLAELSGERTYAALEAAALAEQARAYCEPLLTAAHRETAEMVDRAYSVNAAYLAEMERQRAALAGRIPIGGDDTGDAA